MKNLKHVYIMHEKLKPQYFIKYIKKIVEIRIDIVIVFSIMCKKSQRVTH